MPRKTPANMDRLSVSLPPCHLEAMEKRMVAGEFPSVAEGIRYAVREYLENHPLQGGAAACPAAQ